MQSGWYAGSEPNRRRLKASMNFREIIGTDTNLDVEMKTFQLLLLVQVEVEKKVTTIANQVTWSMMDWSC